jgi:hypothetical protein
MTRNAIAWPIARATREEAMAAFRRAFDTVPDNTIDKSA